MANTIQIKRAGPTGTLIPTSLAVGELAYSENGNQFYIGTTGSTITTICGGADHTKLAGIQAGAQVNSITSVNYMTGAVLITASNIGLGLVSNVSSANLPLSTAATSALALKAPIASPIFTGAVTLATITPSASLEAAAKGYVDSSISSLSATYAPKASPTFTGTVTVPTPVNATDATTKSYVDNVAAGINVKQSVKVATTIAGTLATSFANGQTIDGQVLFTGERILIKNQVTGSENGIYLVNASGAPTRTTDGVTGELNAGSLMFVETGTLNAATQWILTNPNPITVGTTSLSFTIFTSGSSYSAGTGLTLTGTVYAIDTTVLTTTSTLDVTKLSTGIASAFNGSAITSLNGSAITSGTVAAARLDASVLFNTSIIDGGTF